VLLGERIEARRVLDGVLGCANCREQYPVRGGWADLRGGSTAPRDPEAGGPSASPHDPGAGGPTERPAPEAVVRLAAQLGVRVGPGFVLVAGVGAELAAGVAGLVEGLEVVAVGVELAGRGEVPGVSRLAVGRVLPLAPGSMRAVALRGDGGGIALEEAARVVGPLGRLVVDDAGPTVLERLGRAGFEVLARDGAEVVAVRR